MSQTLHRRILAAIATVAGDVFHARLAGFEAEADGSCWVRASVLQDRWPEATAGRTPTVLALADGLQAVAADMRVDEQGAAFLIPLAPLTAMRRHLGLRAREVELWPADRPPPPPPGGGRIAGQLGEVH